MGMFSALDSSASGAKLGRIWLDTISDNIANVNTVRPADEEPFRARLVVAQSYENGDDRGAKVQRLALDGGEPKQAYDPTNPMADEKGYVKLPQVDLSVEMTNVMIAQRSYQANLSVMERVQNAYRSALSIGVK